MKHVVNTKQESIAFRNSMSVSSTEILMSDTTPEYYIFNYEDNKGYAVIGADERALGEYTSLGTGAIDSSLDNPGLITMLEETVNYVYDKREELELLRDSIYEGLVTKIDSMVEADSDTSSTTLTGGRIWEEEDESNWVVSTRVISRQSVQYWEGSGVGGNDGPLLTTEWHQRYPYNNNYAGNCSNTGPGWGNTRGSGRHQAGCVPISYAQVIAYFRARNNYGGNVWNNITAPINGQINDNNREHMRLVPSLVRQIFTDFSGRSEGCDATSVPSGGSFRHLGNAIIRPKYNFRHGEWRDYDYGHIVRSIQNHSPVIIRGATRATCCWWIFCRECDGSGHQWVIDGYRRWVQKITVRVEFRYGSGRREYMTFTSYRILSNTDWHHNWGWGAPNWVIAGTNQRDADNSNFARGVKIIAYITWNG